MLQSLVRVHQQDGETNEIQDEGESVDSLLLLNPVGSLLLLFNWLLDEEIDLESLEKLALGHLK
jgi:hypothetical protein